MEQTCINDKEAVIIYGFFDNKLVLS